MTSSANEDTVDVEIRCTDDEVVYLERREEIELLPAFHQKVIKRVSVVGDYNRVFVTSVPFPHLPIKFLVDNVALYTDDENVEQVMGFYAATKDMNLLELERVMAAAKYFQCSDFIKMLVVVEKRRSTHFLYLNNGKTLRASARSDDMSGITFRFADDGEIFVGDRKLISLLPLYRHMIEMNCPDWEKKSAKFNYFVKVPFSMKIVKTIFDCVTLYRAPPTVYSQEFVDQFYPESTKWTIEELADISEAAIFFETTVLEQVTSYVGRERIQSLNPDEDFRQNFGKVLRSFNHGFKPSTSNVSYEFSM